MRKKCSLCGKLQSIANFGRDKYTKDKVHQKCLACRRSEKHKLSKRFSEYKTNAKRRNLVFNVSIDEFKVITSKKCKYCGKYSGSYNGEPFCGLDRLNSKIGYIIGNVVPCCPMCNYMKHLSTSNEFIDQVVTIYNNLYKEGELK
jgi:hypothetical protein